MLFFSKIYVVFVYDKKERFSQQGVGMIVDISIAVAAAAFLLLVIYFIVLIKAVKATLNQVNSTLSEVRHHLDEIGIEAKKTTFDVNYKMESLNSVFKAISNVGEFLEQKSKSMKLEAEICSLKNEALAANKHAGNSRVNLVFDQVASILELVGQSFRLWRDVHKRR